MQNEDGFPKYQVSGVGSDIYNMNGLGYETAGVDEWIEFGDITSELEDIECQLKQLNHTLALKKSALSNSLR